MKRNTASLILVNSIIQIMLEGELTTVLYPRKTLSICLALSFAHTQTHTLHSHTWLRSHFSQCSWLKHACVIALRLSRQEKRQEEVHVINLLNSKEKKKTPKLYFTLQTYLATRHRQPLPGLKQMLKGAGWLLPFTYMHILAASTYMLLTPVTSLWGEFTHDSPRAAKPNWRGHRSPDRLLLKSSIISLTQFTSEDTSQRAAQLMWVK